MKPCISDVARIARSSCSRSRPYLAKTISPVSDFYNLTFRQFLQNPPRLPRPTFFPFSEKLLAKMRFLDSTIMHSRGEKRKLAARWKWTRNLARNWGRKIGAGRKVGKVPGPFGLRARCSRRSWFTWLSCSSACFCWAGSIVARRSSVNFRGSMIGAKIADGFFLAKKTSFSNTREFFSHFLVGMVQNGTTRRIHPVFSPLAFFSSRDTPTIWRKGGVRACAHENGAKGVRSINRLSRIDFFLESRVIFYFCKLNSYWETLR